MELLTNIITGYLKHNKRLVVPKLGAFIVKQPGGTIIFSELMRNDDGVLRSLLVAYGCNELAANGMIDRFSFEIRHKISLGETYTIADFGEFSSGENNTIHFKHKREPKVYGGTIKPPIDRLTEEKLKHQRIQRIRQQQSENLTGHSTHRKLKSSQAISTNNHRHNNDDDMELGKPDKYLRGLKYENRKNRNNDDERFGGDRPKRQGGSNAVFLLIVAIILGVGGWFIWRWTEQNNTTPEVESVTTEQEVVEPADSLNSAAPEQAPATTTLVEPILPTSLPAMTPSVVTPLLPTTITTQQPATAAAKI